MDSEAGPDPEGRRHKQDLATLRLAEVQRADSQILAQGVINHLELLHSLNLTFSLASSLGCFCACSDQAEAQGSKNQLLPVSRWHAEPMQVASRRASAPQSPAQQRASRGQRDRPPCNTLPAEWMSFFRTAHQL